MEVLLQWLQNPGGVAEAAGGLISGTLPTTNPKTPFKTPSLKPGILKPYWGFSFSGWERAWQELELHEVWGRWVWDLVAWKGKGLRVQG